MKKWTALLLTPLLALGLAACGSPASSASSAQPAPAGTGHASTEAAPEGTTSGQAETESGSGKTLVVYFSASGNTERVAKDIAQAAGGDLFALTPAVPYTEEDLNWRQENSRVNREHEDESLRNVSLTTTEVTDWAAYDTVFIGYPKMEYLNKSVYSA